MLDPRDEPDRLDEALPRLALARERAPPVGGERVEAAPPLPRLLDPAPLQPATLLEAVEQWVQRGDVELEQPLRPRLDELADLVTVTRTVLDDREDDQLRGAFLELAVE